MALESLRHFRVTHPALHAELEGARWEYWAGGEGPEGMLLLGGGISFGDGNHRLVSLFEAEKRVLSPSYPRVRSVAQLADGLAKLLDHERLQKVDVFGHSLGAGIAHAFVRRHPDRVNRLALCSFGLYTPMHLFGVRGFQAAMELLPFSALRRHYGRQFDQLAREAGPERAAELHAISAEVFSRHTRESALSPLRLLGDLFGDRHAYRLRERVPGPGRVLLLLANDDGGFSRREQDALVNTYPGASVTRFLNGGHLIGLTRAQELERKLEFFFRGNPLVHSHAPLHRVGARASA